MHLIQSLVFTHVTYCLPAWAPPTQEERHRIDNVINLAARIVTKKRRQDHITAARRELGWMSFGALIEYRDSVLMHAIVPQDEGPQRLKALIKHRADVSERETRASTAGQLETCCCRLEATRMTVPVRAVRMWNRLDNTVRENSVAKSFRKSVRAVVMTEL